jgi:hypothetical protein
MDPLEEILGPEYAPAIASALTMVGLVPTEAYQGALDRINHAEAVGPMVNPSAWMGGAFARSRQWKDVLRALIQLRAALKPEEVKT